MARAYDRPKAPTPSPATNVDSWTLIKAGTLSEAVGQDAIRLHPQPRRTTLLSRRDRDRSVQRRWVLRMRQYELMVILDPELEERTVAPSLDQFLNVIRQGGGTVGNIDIWGRRRLAYEIDKKSEGIYAVVDLTAEPDTVKELDRQLNLNESVLRTKVIRPDK
jgi:small subunit ribosomal protein S6